MTIPRAPEEEPVIADIEEVNTAKLIRGLPGIFKMRSEKNVKPGAIITTAPKATADAVAKIGAIELLAPKLKTAILLGINCLKSQLAVRMAAKSAMKIMFFLKNGFRKGYG